MRILFFILLFSFSQYLIAQDCCDTNSKLVICYTSKNDFCPPSSNVNCEYTLDGNFLQGINQKINNSANFGSGGISNCDAELVRMRNINSTQDLNDLECDIVFLGAFGLENTELDLGFLNIVNTWSKECEENLTILFQGETTAWGYQIAKGNENPNRPDASVDINIFDGPFGSLNSFDQGGTFQAAFTVVPSTGTTILARDNENKPTIVLDQATNDILLADVGIFCNPNAGQVSNSRFIENNNDILACNLLALGCDIASGSSFNEELVLICPDEEYTLPHGDIVTDEGVYTSNLLSIEGCDSTIITTLEFSINPTTTVEYMGCDGDGYIETVGSEDFDQAMPTGSVMLLDQYGCDSLVEVELFYFENTTGALDTLICADGSYTTLGTTFTQQTDTVIVAQNLNGCDSVVSVSIDFEFLDDVVIESEIVVVNNADYTFNNTIPSKYSVEWSPSIDLSCSDCPNPILQNTQNDSVYTITLPSDRDCQRDYKVNVSYICEPYIPNTFQTDALDGENRSFGLLAPCPVAEYSLNVYDRWGNLMFATQDQTQMWNGTYDNKVLDAGVYVYLIEYNDGEELQTKTGSITLVR